MRYLVNHAEHRRIKITSHASQSAADAASGGQPPLTHFGPENVLSGLQAWKEWQGCWLRTIGLVWKSEGSNGTNPMKEALLADPHGFFKKHCNYDVPPTMQIQVEPDDGSTWTYNADNELSWLVRPSVMTMFLPNKPADPKDWALALADFEAISTMQPFSFTIC